MPERGDLVVSLTRGDGATAERVGPKAATLATLSRAGLRVPDGFCLTADAYRVQLASAGVEDAARRVAHADGHDARRLALEVRLGLIRAPFAPAVAEVLHATHGDRAAEPGASVAVRSSALLEDSPTASFAGQFESFLGITTHADLLTAVRACWASLWSTRALRYMQAHDVDPGRTAMAVLVQTLIPACAAGGALSRTPRGEILITGTWGLGSAIAQGEVVPDRFLLEPDGSLASVEPGRKERQVTCSPDAGPLARPVSAELVAMPCLTEDEAVALAGMVLAAESRLGMPLEIEWAKDDRGFHLVQARPLTMESPHVEDDVWLRHPGLRGQPSGVGWSTGPARLVLHEHDLDQVNVGDVLVTQVAGPALAAVLPRVAGVVAELGGSTSHLAALARERGIPAVLGLRDATRRIPEGAMVAVDGVAGVVRWIA
jgi:pyruvate, water dikinase